MGILTRVCYNRHNEMTVVWRKSWNGKESCAACFNGSKHINMRWWDCICLYFWRVLGFWSWWWRNRRWSFIVRLMLGGATICLVIYAIWPNGLDLRREITTHNFCAEIVRFLRSVDPPYNVCPSIHVSSTVSVHRIICQSCSFRDNKKMKWISRGVTWAICLSTMLIKQHSVIDVVFGWLLTEVMTVLYNGWRPLREID